MYDPAGVRRLNRGFAEPQTRPYGSIFEALRIRRGMNANRIARPTPAVFLDKDGTLIDDVPYNVDPARIRLAVGAAEALPLLHEAGYTLVVVSNQSGVARGLFPESALVGVERRLRDLLAGLGVPLAAFRYCPHHPDGVVAEYAVACDCRNLAPGRPRVAGRRLGHAPARS